MKDQILYRGPVSKTYEQSISIMTDLVFGKKVDVYTTDSEKYKANFKANTGRELILEEIKEAKNLYLASLKPV